ncbi:MAG: hypothetical protein HY466_07430 [Deltaproteobacteria bacterium]|nr:hypothetical protein [Deltaproteobacteria bacterium]
MKKLGLSLLGLFLVVAAVRVVPCSKGASLHACCEKGVQANIANPFTTCCEQERSSTVIAALNKNFSTDFQAATALLAANAVTLDLHRVFQPVRFHWPNHSKNPLYLQHAALLL